MKFAWDLGWGAFAAAAGLLCFALPPHLTPNGLVNPPYGHPLIPWFASAFQNVRLMPTLISLVTIGVILGIASKWWFVLAWLTVSLILILNMLNIVHDWIISPTSHNLFPFEILIVFMLALPAIMGGTLGMLIRWFVRFASTAPA